MKVNWLIPTSERNYNRVLASIWIRCLQLIPFLDQLGIQSVINEPNSDAPICYFVRWQNDDAYEIAKRAKGNGKKIVFDLVANYFDESPATEGRLRIDECLRFVALADMITVCSQFIAQRALKHHHNVTYLPDSINIDHFSGNKDPQDFLRPKLRLIWSGNHSKIRELDPIFQLAKKIGYETIVISNKQPARHKWRLINKPYQFKKWQYESFPNDILTGDICFSHRDTNSVYNQGHSFFKIAVMMALGLPVIASPVPSYEELINPNNQTGWLCNSLDEWEHLLRHLQSNRSELTTRATNAVSAIAPFTTQHTAAQYADVFQRTISSE